jgi:hypothetical protein
MTGEEERELNSIGIQMFGKQLIMLDDTEMTAVLAEKAAQQRNYLRGLIATALDASIDQCTRCKTCDVQVDAVMAVLEGTAA